MNLCTNAAHAMGENGGLLDVTLEDTLIDCGSAWQGINLPPGEYIRLTVNDTGCGMPPTVVERLFDPYFTTKPKGEGSGLGMAVVHGIVSHYGGAINVYSEENRGTTVTVYLPRHTDSATVNEDRTGIPPTGKETVLLVDDEPQLIAIEEKMLTRLGYKVTTCQDSLEALEIFRRQPQAFQAVVTDMSMPKMNGVAFSRAILGIRRDIPIVLCTGYSPGLNPDNARSIGVRSILMKPISMPTLAASIRQAIDAG
jgi:CheY-like chemotaxis protein/anti-sigma regulatory factor (Ser/Thr protein kinase)